MIKSMTGFGKGQTITPQGTVHVEIRSLNHRYFDLASRLPNHFSFFEDKVRDYLKKRINRGRVNLAVSWESKARAQTRFSLDLTLAKKYHRQLLKLKKSLNLKDDLGVQQIMGLPEVITYEQKKENLRQLYPHLKSAIVGAFENLDRMRSAEGKRLARDLQKRVRRIRRYLHSIELQLPKVIARYKRNLLKKVKGLSGVKAPHQDRIAEEVALFVRSSDVSEELTRLISHLKGFRMALRNQKEAGKELDFIAQEMFREANTIGAKASSYNISRTVIKIKGQIEKLREQLQNVE
ncbi:YicC/YloC family endoribonuclease [Candidatus Omnitrophota bacterium]